MCVQDSDLADTDLLKSDEDEPNCPDLQTQIESTSFPLESISEDRVVALDDENNESAEFLPILREGEWSDIGGRDYMEDTHVCIADLAENFGCKIDCDEAVSFYGVFDGHGGKCASQFVRDHLPRVIVEDADFPLYLEKAVARSFVKTDDAFAEACSLGDSQPSGTTALTAMIFGRSLLVANAGDCRAVLSRRGVAIAMSKDHRTCCRNERARIKPLGGYIIDEYLNGQLMVTRAIGDWHIDGMKKGGPLISDPEMKLITLTREDEFLIIGSDGIWDLFSNQNAVDFARKSLQTHNDVKSCCRKLVEEVIRMAEVHGLTVDNLTVVMVCFQSEPPTPIASGQKTRVSRSISAEGLHTVSLHMPS